MFAKNRSDLANLKRYRYFVQLMNAKTILILTLVAITPYIVPMNNANAFDSVCNLAGANSTAVKQCVQGYIGYQKMNHSTDSQMQQVLDNQRDTIRHDTITNDPNQTKSWVESKGQLAHQMQKMDVINRDWYNLYTKQTLHQMNIQVKLWKSYDHNPVPTQQTCPRWHDCTYTITYTMNYTKPIPLKPEFINHSSGVIQNSTPIKNWIDFDRWFEKNQTKN